MPRLPASAPCRRGRRCSPSRSPAGLPVSPSASCRADHPAGRPDPAAPRRRRRADAEGIKTTFTGLPDVPLSRFELNLDGGNNRRVPARVGPLHRGPAGRRGVVRRAVGQADRREQAAQASRAARRRRPRRSDHPPASGRPARWIASPRGRTPGAQAGAGPAADAMQAKRKRARGRGARERRRRSSHGRGDQAPREVSCASRPASTRSVSAKLAKGSVRVAARSRRAQAAPPGHAHPRGRRRRPAAGDDAQGPAAAALGAAEPAHDDAIRARAGAAPRSGLRRAASSVLHRGPFPPW